MNGHEEIPTWPLITLITEDNPTLADNAVTISDDKLKFANNAPTISEDNLIKIDHAPTDNAPNISKKLFSKLIMMLATHCSNINSAIFVVLPL